MAEHSESQALLTAVRDVPPGRLLVAVSGGPDSVALLLALREAGREVSVGHVNHLLRGAESDADEAFVRSLAERLAVSVLVERVKTAEAANQPGMSLEMAARTLRYAALERMRQEWSADWIVTGHTQDDQAETFLLRLLRGTGTSGLGGMRLVTDRIVRPFLGTPSLVVVAALEEWKQPYREDSSNRDPRFTRNRVRLQVLPLLREMNPRVGDRLATTAGILQTDADFIDDQSVRALESLTVSGVPGTIAVSRQGWASLQPALALGVARAVIARLLGDVSHFEERHIAQMVQAAESGDPPEVHLPRGLRLLVTAREVAVATQARSAASSMIPDATLEIPGRITLPEGTMTAELMPSDRLDRLLAVVGPFHALLDADATGPRLAVRSRRPGDRIKPAGSRVTRKVQDVLVDARVPLERRDGIPLVSNGTHLVWIPGLAVDRRAAATPETAHILHLVWKPNPSW